jgi:hypothetical protein
LKIGEHETVISRLLAIFKSKGQGEKMAEKESCKCYDFSDKNPSDILTEDELAHFDEGMKIKNTSVSSSSIDFGRAVQSVVPELDALFS